MRARPVVLLTAGLLVLAAACSDSSSADGKAKVDTDAPTTQLAAAVQAVQSGLPVDLPRSSIEVLLQDLCSLGPSDAASAVGSQLAPLAGEPSQASAVLAALDAGTTKLCPDSVDPAARAAAESALAPATTTTAGPAVAASSGSGRGGSSSGSSTGTRSSSSKVSNGPATATGSVDESTGSASAGGGNANGSGNQSSTSYSQDVSGSDSSSSASN